MTVSTTSVITVFIISGLIGELSFVFQTELPYSIALVIHLIGTFILYSVMMLINHWPLNWQNHCNFHYRLYRYLAFLFVC